MEVDYFEQIGDYLRGELTEDEVKSFEVAMEKDELLRETVKDYPLLRKVTMEVKREQARNLVQEVIKKREAEEAKVVRIPFKLKRWAAIILLLIMAAFTYSNIKYPTDTILGAAHDAPTEMVFKSGEALDREWNDVMEFWNGNNKTAARR